jgi:hypothetical protein
MMMTKIILLLGLGFVGLLVQPLDARDNNTCVEIDCLKELIKRNCMEGIAPSYLDCENILRCIDAGEEEILRECVKGYPADNESRLCNSQDLLYRGWCDYTRGAIPK